MKYFDHENAATFQAASQLLAEAASAGKRDSVAVMAGGSDLICVLKDRILDTYPEKVVDLKTIVGAEYIKEEDGQIEIGAMTKLKDIIDSSLLMEKLPILCQAAKSVATPLIRNVATLGGNICQDVRCWFYRYPREGGGMMNCLRKSGDTCFAIKGDDRYHSIYGAKSGCLAVNPSDLAPVLMILDAQIVTTSRTIGAEEFFTAHLKISDLLSAGELVTAVKIPVVEGYQMRYDKFRVRNAVDFAIVSLASMFRLENAMITDVRMVQGGVAPVPKRASEAEAFLIGKAPSQEVAKEAGQIAVQGCKPMKNNGYKVQEIKVLTERAVLSMGNND